MQYGEFACSLGLDFRYLLFEGMRTAWRRRNQLTEQVDDLCRRYDAHIEQLYLPWPLTAMGLRIAGRAIARAARCLPGERVLVQGRGAPALCAALHAKRVVPSVVTLYDARSDGAAEARLQAAAAVSPSERGWWERRAKRIEALEQLAGAGADHVLAVSTPLRDHICQLSDVSPDKVTVVPCCADPSRFLRSNETRLEMRHRLGLTDRLVFVYSGSLSLYQIPEQVGAVMMHLHDYLSTAHLLVLSRDQEGARRAFRAMLEKGMATLHDCPFDEVGNYLSAADVAFLLRADDPVNRVACPVKFAEYQLAGLPVVATPNIGDVSSYVAESGYGLLIDLDASPETEAQRIADSVRCPQWQDRDAIRRHASTVFCRDSYRELYGRILRQLEIGMPGARYAS